MIIVDRASEIVKVARPSDRYSNLTWQANILNHPTGQRVLVRSCRSDGAASTKHPPKVSLIEPRPRLASIVITVLSSTRTHSRFGRFGRFGRFRFRYDYDWWGEGAPATTDQSGYWATTRRPLPSLALVLPLLVAYEVGLICLGGSSSDALRAGADTWLRHALKVVGLTDRWLLPLLLTSSLLAWQALDRRDWRFHPLVLGGMVLESLLLAIALIGLSKLVDLGLVRLDGPLLATRAISPSAAVAPLIGFIGAGIYEEALFRLASIPLFYWLLKLVTIPQLPACTLAITASSLLFSLAHHAGTPGEVFTLFAFVFRWLAGVFFAYVFVARGFGVAVGTHSAYDLLVSWGDVHF